MTPKQELELRGSRIRERLAELAAEPETLTDDQTSELDSLLDEQRALEPKLRAAIASEPDPEPSRGWAEVEARASLSDFLSGTATGAGKEMADELGLASGMVPIDLLADPVETRADTVTTSSTISGSPKSSRRILDMVFPMEVSRSLGVSPTMVGTGTHYQRYVASGPTASTVAESSERDADAAFTITASELSPTRLQARAVVTRESMLTAGPDLERAVRTYLRSELNDELEGLVIAGDGTSPNPTGLVTAVTAPTDPGTTVTYAGVASQATNLVDGKYVSSGSGVAIALPVAAYAKGGSLYPTNGGGSALAALTGSARSVMVTSYLTTASNISQGLARLGNVPGEISLFVWRGFNLLVDQATLADKAQVAYTATMYFDFKVVRSDSLKRFAWKVA